MYSKWKDICGNVEPQLSGNHMSSLMLRVARWSSICHQCIWVCVSVRDVVSEGCVSLQQPQEKCLLEEPQGRCTIGNAADLQHWLVWNRCTSQTCRYQLRHILQASGWTVYQLNGFACCLCSYCPEMMLRNFKQELAARLISFQKGRPLEEYGLTVSNQQTLVYEWVSQQREYWWSTFSILIIYVS